MVVIRNRTVLFIKQPNEESELESLNKAKVSEIFCIVGLQFAALL